MTVTYSPDLAPDLQPEVVRWQPRYKTQDQRELELRIAMTLAAAAVGAVALGALAFGALAISRFSASRSRFRGMQIGDFRVRRLRRPF